MNKALLYTGQIIKVKEAIESLKSIPVSVAGITGSEEFPCVVCEPLRASKLSGGRRGCRAHIFKGALLDLKNFNSKCCATFNFAVSIYGLHPLCVVCIPYRLHARPWHQMSC